MALIELFILILVLLTVLYCYLTRNFNYWNNKGVQNDRPLPLFGNLLDVVLGQTSLGKKFEEWHHKNDVPYFGIYAVDTPFLILKDPAIIKRVLITDFHIFRNRYIASDENADPIFTNTLFAIRNTHWKLLRSKLSPIFTSGKMKMMFQLMKECGDDLKKYLLTMVDQNIEMKEICTKYTTDVIASCAFGINANCFKSKNSEFLAAGRKIFSFTAKRFFQVFCFFFFHKFVTIFKLKFIDPTAADFLREAFWNTVNKREATKTKRNDLIDVLIEMKNDDTGDNEFKVYEDRLVAQAVIFFTAGHETTSTTIAFTLYELCINPHIQTRLRNEIIAVIDRYGDITYEGLNEMKYLHMVVSETLRKYPVTPLITRYASEDYKIEETGLVIDKGTPILISQYGLHSDPKYFPEPAKYDPERFSDVNKNKIPSGVYLPFGEGPRNCIGERFGLMSTKLGIIYIITNFLIEKSLTTPVPMVLKARAPLTVSEVGIPVILRKL